MTANENEICTPLTDEERARADALKAESPYFDEHGNFKSSSQVWREGDPVIVKHNNYSFSSSHDLNDVIYPKLEPICAKNIKQMPPPREWAWKYWMPTGSVTGFGGPGGVGKSTLAQQIATHKAIGKRYLNCEMQQAPALYLTCEDSQDELDRRQFAINDGLGITMDDLSNLHLLSRIGEEDSRLVDLKANNLNRTPLFDRVDEMMGDYKFKMAFFDLVPDFWNGNEIVRQQVNSFVKGHLGYLADRHQCAVVGLYHPSQSGKNSGTGESGSTAWEGSFRSRIYLAREDSTSLERTLTRKKSNYAEVNDGDKIIWDNGYFMEAEKMKASPAEQKEEHNKKAFMDLMIHCKNLDIDVSPSSNSPGYYGKKFPSMWLKIDKRHTSITKKQFENAYTQLQFEGKVQELDRDNKKGRRIVIRNA